MKKNWITLLALWAVCFMEMAAADELRVLSAGAIEPGVRAAVAAFQKQGGHPLRLTFNTAPQIRKRMQDGERWDVVIAPPAVIEALAQARQAGAERVSVGRVGLGVAVRPGAPVPDISSAEALKRSVLEADSLVFNRASTGVYLEGLLRKMGVYEQIEARTTRYADGASVLEHVLHGKGREIGFGAITEILLYRDKGLQLVGPLPAEAQNYTAYSASATPTTTDLGAARTFITYLGSPASRALFAAAGIEP